MVATGTSNSGGHDEVLLPMCKVEVIGPDSYTHQYKAFLDSALSAFFMEWFARQLHLPRSHQRSNVSGIGGGANAVISQDYKIQGIARLSWAKDLTHGSLGTFGDNSKSL